MRIYIFTTIFLIICAISLQGATQWELVEKEHTITINDFEHDLSLRKMTSFESKIFAVYFRGLYGVASLDVSNLENDWEVCFEAPMHDLNYNPRFYDYVKIGDKLFLPSDSGMVYHSFDRGESWDSTYLGDEFKHPIKHLKFVNDSVGFLGHTHKYGFLKTTDGGRTWNPLPPVNGQMPEVFILLNFVPIDENTIYLVGRWHDGYHFYFTEDGGNTWNELDTKPFEGYPQVPAQYYHLEYINNQFIVEKRYKPGAMGNTSLMTSKDFVNWDPLFISDTISGGKHIHHIQYFEDVSIGLGSRVFIISTDNGETWVDKYNENDTFYADNNPINGFAYIDGYIYAQGHIKGNRHLYRYKLDIKASIEEEITNLSVYPNPAQSEVNITYEKGLESIEVIDINGRSMISLNNLNLTNVKIINVDELSTGTYFIRINDKIYKRFVKE
jgi:hypothetical protein